VKYIHVLLKMCLVVSSVVSSHGQLQIGFIKCAKRHDLVETFLFFFVSVNVVPFLYFYFRFCHLIVSIYFIGFATFFFIFTSIIIPFILI
jgi:hypothetical protein